MERLDESIAKVEVGADAYYRGLYAASRKVGSGDLLYGLNARYYDGPWENPENGTLFSGLLKYTGGGESDGYSLEALGYHNDWGATDQIARRAVEGGATVSFQRLGFYRRWNNRPLHAGGQVVE